jgi:HSP20 family molecular chaperone IbpA
LPFIIAGDCSSVIHHEPRLAAEVEPEKPATVFKEGVLELAFAKAAVSKALDVEVYIELFGKGRITERE